MDINKILFLKKLMYCKGQAAAQSKGSTLKI
jgi:hypothetical protein